MTKSLIESKLDRLLPKPHKNFITGNVLRSRLIVIAKANVNNAKFDENGQVVVQFDSEFMEQLETYYRLNDVSQALFTELAKLKVDISGYETNIPVMKKKIEDLIPQAILSRNADTELQRERTLLQKAENNLERKQKTIQEIEQKIAELSEATLDDVYSFLSKLQIVFSSTIHRYSTNTRTSSRSICQTNWQPII